MKYCIKCKENKELSEFYKCSASKDGYNSYCKECNKKEVAKNRKNNRNKEKKEVFEKKCQRCGRILPISFFNKDIGRIDGYSCSCKECNKNMLQIFRTENPGYMKEYNPLYYQKNRDIIIEKIKDYRINNPEKIKEWSRIRERDPLKRLISRLRHRLHSALIGECKCAKTIELLGCTPLKLKQYLESQFQEGMTWKNMGEWHVDHIIPCDYFDLSDLEQQRICFNFRNLQPLWAEDNLSKSNKVPENVEELINNLRGEIKC